jgi:hypothetical protein
VSRKPRPTCHCARRTHLKKHILALALAIISIASSAVVASAAAAACGSKLLIKEADGSITNCPLIATGSDGSCVYECP